MMTRRQKRQVYVALTLLCLLLFAVGLGVGYHSRHSTICRDGKAPRLQQDLGIEGTRYLCHDGQIVTQH